MADSELIRRSYKLFWFFLASFLSAFAAAQERYSPFVPTDESDVVRMLKLAGVREGDVVFDLGSGDGRIVLEAGRMNARVRGRRIEMDEKLVAESTARAQAAGLADRVQFIHQNAFDTDLSDATVITMWLWPEVMHMLRPKILEEARPGTRVVTRMWDLGTWPPDEKTTDGNTLYKWIVPAKVAGSWDWTLTIGERANSYTAILDQRYQTAEGFARTGSRRAVLNGVKVEGDEISFSILMGLEGRRVVRHQYRGRVAGDVIEGTVSVLAEPYDKAIEMPWRAQRAANAAYFAPTGIDPEAGR
ncbi:MAG: putative methylase [Betaproteobacteria bacterium]|nr:putative methylase [Betaproteobacteria bacterium]